MKIANRVRRSCVWFAMLCLVPGFAAWSGGMAPLNPDFIAWRDAGKALDAANLGYIPSPADWSHLRKPEGRGKAALPSSFDLRYEANGLTGVRNQGSCGSCWSFAAYGSLESGIRRQAPGEVRDFSENHMKNTHGFAWGSCDGGNNEMAAAYLSRGGGPVNEADDPYNAYNGTSPAGLQSQKYVRFMPLFSYAPETDTTAIKTTLMEQGALAISMHWDDASYDYRTNLHKYTGGADPNHGVTLVGWDDAARVWICKNSWGYNFGDGGFFFLSYDDTKALGSVAGFFDTVPAGAYDRIYQHDPLGMVNMEGLDEGDDQIWGANTFTAQADGHVVAVGTYAVANNTQYEIIVYGSGLAGSGFANPLATVSGTWVQAGYQVVSLPTPAAINNGQSFTIAIHYTTPGYMYPLPIEMSLSDYANASAQRGQSYYSADGVSYVDFQDKGTDYLSVNGCIKALATDNPGVHITGATLIEAGEKLSLLAVTSNMDGPVAYQWRQDGVALDGETDAAFTLLASLPQHTGRYQVTATDTSKATYWSKPFLVNVLPEGSLPLAGPVTLAALALALAGLGLRRRK